MEDEITPLGFIEIKRTPSRESGELFRLELVQELTSGLDVINRITADMKCRQDELAYPISWRMTNEHRVSDTVIAPPVSTREPVSVNGDNLVVQRGNRTFRLPAPERFTAECNLIEAVQRLDFDKKPSITFDLLEGLARVKRRMELSYGGTHTFDVGGHLIKTHRFVQMGRGILPYEYFVDDHHRTLLVITFCKAYILKSAS
jgi:hypothetical protein